VFTNTYHTHGHNAAGMRSRIEAAGLTDDQLVATKLQGLPHPAHQLYRLHQISRRTSRITCVSQQQHQGRMLSHVELIRGGRQQPNLCLVGVHHLWADGPTYMTCMSPVVATGIQTGRSLLWPRLLAAQSLPRSSSQKIAK
jgi:hypothetical protein